MQSVYIVRSRPDNMVMRCTTTDAMKSYIVGFVSEVAARRAVRVVSVDSSVRLKTFTFDDMSIMSVQKKVNINKLPCMVQEKNFTEFIEMPIKNNIDILFAYDVYEETDTEVSFYVQTYDAVCVSREHLERMMNGHQ